MLSFVSLLLTIVLSEDATEPLKNPNALEVIFENQSGKKVSLYWDDSINGVLQSELSHTSQITINTFLGHRFYFTPQDSNGSTSDQLYAVTMEQHTGLVTLYNEEIMKERGAEFEAQKNLFMKEYFEKNGRKWKNYYPMEPITHFMYDFENIGMCPYVSTIKNPKCKISRVRNPNRSQNSKM